MASRKNGFYGIDVLEKGGKGRTAQLDYILWPRRKADKAYVHNEVKTWGSHPIYAVIPENEASNRFPARRRRTNGRDGGPKR